MSKPTVKHTKWGKYTAIVAEMVDGKWHANIIRPSATNKNEIHSHLKSGEGQEQLTQTLKSFGAPDNIEWLPGNGE